MRQRDRVRDGVVEGGCRRDVRYGRWSWLGLLEVKLLRGLVDWVGRVVGNWVGGLVELVGLLSMGWVVMLGVTVVRMLVDLNRNGGFGRILVLLEGSELEGTGDVGIEETRGGFVLYAKVVEDSVVWLGQRGIAGSDFVVDLNRRLGRRVAVLDSGRRLSQMVVVEVYRGFGVL